MFTARYGQSSYITQIRFVFKRLNELTTRILLNAESCEHYSGWLRTLFVCLPVLSLFPARAQSDPERDGVAQFRWSLEVE